MAEMAEFEKLEYRRLATEILKDRDLQFRLFWQSVTVTAVIFSFCASIFDSEIWFRFPFIILAPHLILVPTSSIILNRARTANRKSGYLLAAYDRCSNGLNWERDLSKLRQVDAETGEHKDPHRTATIKDMLISMTSLEIICMVVCLVLYFMEPRHHLGEFDFVAAGLGLAYGVFYTHILAMRARAYFCTRYQESIQGYASRWTEVLDIPDSVHATIGHWNKNTWGKRLKAERKTGAMQFVWRVLWSQAKQPNQTWTFKESYWKATAVALIIWPVLAWSVNKLDIRLDQNGRLPTEEGPLIQTEQTSAADSSSLADTTTVRK